MNYMVLYGVDAEIFLDKAKRAVEIANKLEQEAIEEFQAKLVAEHLELVKANNTGFFSLFRRKFPEVKTFDEIIVEMEKRVKLEDFDRFCVRWYKGRYSYKSKYTQVISHLNRFLALDEKYDSIDFEKLMVSDETAKIVSNLYHGETGNA